MSGQLVGEVIAAAPQLRAMGLSPNGFHALIAIAEKCHHMTRQASVRREWIQAAIYGSSSPRSAERAVRELRDLKLIDVLKRGYKAPNHKAMASTYQLMELPPPIVADADSEAPATPGRRELAAAKSVEADAKSDKAPATQSGGLDVCPDVCPDGDARASAHARTRKAARTDKPDSRSPHWATPPPKCHKHPNGYEHHERCWSCKALRSWDENADQRRNQNYAEAWEEYNRLAEQARAGMYGEWRPKRPPRFRSEFDPNVPWRQPNPPAKADLTMNGYAGW